MEDFKVIIAGTRDFADYELLREKCDAILSNRRQNSNIVIVSGTARGADRLGERYARERGYQILRFPADWDRDGNSAGPIRNAKMADNANALIAFWDGHSRGTKNMIDTAASKGLMVRTINFKNINMQQKNNEKDAVIDKLRVATADLAVKHIKEGNGLKELNEKFNDYYNAISTPGVRISRESDIGHRQLLAQKVAIDCIRQLSNEQLSQLDKELMKVVENKGLTPDLAIETTDRIAGSPVTQSTNIIEDGYDSEQQAYLAHIESSKVDLGESRDAVVVSKLDTLRDLLGSGDFTLIEADHPGEAVTGYEVGHYSDGEYALSPVFEKSGTQRPKSYDYDSIVRELNNKLNAVKPKKVTVDFLLKHPVKSIGVDVLPNKQDPFQAQVTGVIVKGHITSNDHILHLVGAKIIDANIDWGDHNLQDAKDNPAEYLIGNDLYQELGKELADKILSMKESGTIPYPAISDDAGLLNDFYGEQAAVYAEQAKEAIYSRATDPSARQFAPEQEKNILMPGMRLSVDERTSLFDDLFKAADSKLATAHIPDAWKQSAHEELMDLAKNGPSQHHSNGLHR